MKITAMAIGSRGDVAPFVYLGEEMKKRGHDFTVASFFRFESFVKEHGLVFHGIHGDEELMMRLLLSECHNGTDYLKGLEKLLNKDPQMLEDCYEACKNADLIIYVLLGGFCHHVAEKFHIPLVRVFFYLFDKTKAFSIQIPALPHNNYLNGFTYNISEFGLNMVSKKLLNPWRKEMGLRLWRLRDSYLNSDGKPCMTLYPFSEVLVPRPKEWGSHIHITGYWNENSSHVPIENKKVKEFLKSGDKPVYIGFGSIVYQHMDQVQECIYRALEKTGQRAIINRGWAKEKLLPDSDRICHVDFVDHQWLFPQVKAVVHHGGAGTTQAGLRAGRPTFVIAFGGDQYFWGRQIYERGLGPKPINLAGKPLKESKLVKGLRLLEQGFYEKNAKKAAEKLNAENGISYAADLLEHHMICTI